MNSTPRNSSTSKLLKRKSTPSFTLKGKGQVFGVMGRVGDTLDGDDGNDGNDRNNSELGMVLRVGKSVKEREYIYYIYIPNILTYHHTTIGPPHA